MTRICRELANWLERNCDMSKEEYAVALYGLQVMLNSTIKIAGIFLIGVVCGIWQEVLFTMLVFCSMRYWAGGWHSSTHIGCFSTMLCICVCPAFLKSIEGNWVILVWVCMVLYSLYSILRYAPRNSKVNPIVDICILKRKRIGSMVEAFMLVVIMLLCKSTEICWLISVPLFFEAITISPATSKDNL